MNQETTTQQFRFDDKTLDLHILPKRTFLPNQTTETIYKAIKINPNETGIELGSGIGPLSILIASQPITHLYTIEIIQEQCELARKNVLKYGLEKRITILQGFLFEPLLNNFPEIKANFIVSDVSGMTNIGYELGWYPKNIPAGGTDGTELIIPLIIQAPYFLDQKNPSSRLYFPVVTNFSDSNKILEAAKKTFNKLEEKASRKIPLKAEQLAIVENSTYRPFAPIERKGTRGYWEIKVYEAREPI